MESNGFEKHRYDKRYQWFIGVGSTDFQID